MTEPELIIPETIDRTAVLFKPQEKFVVYIPIPNTENDGIYVNHVGFVALMRANKNNPDAIQYLADMLE